MSIHRKRPPSHYYANIGCGALLAFIGSAVIGGAALSFGEDGQIIGELLMVLFFGVAPVGIGIALVSRALVARRKAVWEEIERQVLTIAQRRGGVVNALEVAAETDLSFDETKRYLDRLADQGHVEIEPSESGLVYRFPGAGAGGAPG
ncbi:MAG: hypothetical protein HY321_03020 [Armatimonadetes bacterium]|nr:hypothetical protein [Armatimonadota bacterium]